MTVKDLIDHVLQLKGAPGSSLNTDEGVLLGDANTEIRGLLVTWMADVDALRAASAARCNAVLCHEQFYFTTMMSPFRVQELAWPANRARIQAASAGGLTVLRVHGSLDQICIWDDFVAALGVRDPKPGTGARKVLPIAAATVRKLALDIKRRFNLPMVRISGDPDKTVSLAGFPWGGLGLDTNVGFLAECINLGADVLIAGECDEYGFSFARDASVPMIETGHALSENIGIKLFSERLRKTFPTLAVHFHPGSPAFAVV
jgi:putative NIF3 family GTP cyclohydrolase 1 type 2